MLFDPSPSIGAVFDPQIAGWKHRHVRQIAEASAFTVTDNFVRGRS
jgi:hypothetical protein